MSANVSQYLAQTLQTSTTQTDDITLTTGLSYSLNASNNTVSISSVFGSVVNNSTYYALSKTVYWRNPGAGIGGTYNPSGTSWSYSTDTSPGTYYFQLPPYSLLDCVVTVYGMEYVTRTISVKCSI